MSEKRIDIRWRDLDGLGHVNQAVYPTYGEETVDAWFREALGLGPGEIWNYVVVRMTTNFHSELRLTDGHVVGTTHLVRVGTSSVTVRVELRAGSDGRLAADTECIFACWDPERRSSRPLTDAERAQLEAMA